MRFILFCNVVLMRILSNFDTNIDNILLQNAREKYEKSKVLLVKKYPVYLLKSIPLYIWVLLFSSIFWWTLFQVNDTINLPEILLLASLIILLMFRIGITIKRYYTYSFHFHSTIHASEHTELVSDSKLDSFIKNSIYLIFWFIALFVWFEVKQILFERDPNIRITLLWWATVLIVIFLIYRLIFLHISYDLDFLLITPDSVEHVYQKSFFSRKHRAITLDQVKSIELSQEWILQWVFHLWKILFITDAMKHQKDAYISFDYIWEATLVKDKIQWLMKK